MSTNSITRAIEQNQLFHIHLCGPFKHRSLGGSWYFLTFTNDYSRKKLIYFQSIKFVTFQNFVELQKEIKTTEKLIIAFKDNQRGEFLSNDFKIFYKKNIIRKELTTIETPHQNGVAK